LGSIVPQPEEKVWLKPERREVLRHGDCIYSLLYSRQGDSSEGRTE
jgi:hypothetical protein